MERFLERHAECVTGVLSGFDRLVFRGTLRSINYSNGMDIFLSSHGVLYKNFGVFAERLSGRLKGHAEAIARQRGRRFEYIASSKVSKEDLARSIMEQDRITQGLICVLSCVEPCISWFIRRDRTSRRLVLVPGERKCLHLYFYFVDREFGFMHIRLQTWLPFTIQVCINGREWLAHQLDRAGIGYERRENCFAAIENVAEAQRMFDRLGTREWVPFLQKLADRVNPWVGPKGDLDLRGYYWSVRESEYATDVMFKDTASLRAVYGRLVNHAIEHFSCQDVLRFLGRRVNGKFNGQVTSDIGNRTEGVRLKHRVEENSIKMYDKQGSVLRIETTMNNPRRFKVRRMTTRKGQRRMRWIPMRKSVADISRRVEICRAANHRYLEALSIVGQPSVAASVLDEVSRPIVRDDRPYRPLRPISPDEARSFRILLDGKWIVQGFRNRDILAAMGGIPNDKTLRRQASAQITRWLRLLRAHHLIRKVASTQYYRVTTKGQHVMATALKIRNTDISLLAA
jgi:hypothetical protein